MGRNSYQRQYLLDSRVYVESSGLVCLHDCIVEAHHGGQSGQCSVFSVRTPHFGLITSHIAQLLEKIEMMTSDNDDANSVFLDSHHSIPC